jgi:hypothetical protein
MDLKIYLPHVFKNVIKPGLQSITCIINVPQDIFPKTRICNTFFRKKVLCVMTETPLKMTGDPRIFVGLTFWPDRTNN